MRNVVIRLALGMALTGGLLTACQEHAVRTPTEPDVRATENLDSMLTRELQLIGYTGRIEERFLTKLGRPVDDRLADLGRLLFFDPILSITQDNSCSGCHGPNAAFNDTKSISIGIESNGVVGPGRTGPFNLRRAPTVINAAFYPNLMWDERFASVTLNPFDNSKGFTFPEPEGTSLSHMEHLLGAQTFTPVVSRMEMTGFDFVGDNDEIRQEIANRVDAVDEYHTRFAEVYPEIEAGEPLTFTHIGAAISEFELTLIRADAPLDRFARGDSTAMDRVQKRGALLFFGRKAACFECHITAGFTNEMFSDFDSHVLAVPQLAPSNSYAVYDGPGHDEDFGLERVTGNPDDRYKFRTTPLRNLAYQPTFMHNGAFTCIEEAIRHHTDVVGSLEEYTTARLDPGLRGHLGPIDPVLERVAEVSRRLEGAELSSTELSALTSFVRVSLTDPEASPDALRSLVPTTVPSGLPVHDFDFATATGSCN